VTRRRTTALVAALAIVGGILLPSVLTDPYHRGVMVNFLIYLLFALSMDVLIGGAGMLSLGQAAFLGVGAYASALCVGELGWPPLVALGAGAALAGLVGTLIGLASLLLRSVYFALGTLATAEILRLVALNWDDLTRGPMGLTVPMFTLPGTTVHRTHYQLLIYYVSLAVVIATWSLLAALRRTRAGRALASIRENEPLARSVGIDVFRHKVAIFALASAITGLAGGLYGFSYRIITPSLMGIEYTSIGLLMVLTGGPGLAVGPLLGTLVFTVLSEALRVAGSLRMVLFALLLIVVVIAFPRGLADPRVVLDRVRSLGRTRQASG
jgi:branched-chain amino acid transport system permease protein